MRWWWSKRDKASEETKELREKLKEVKDEGIEIRSLHRRAGKLLRDNHLAADIKKALGA